MSDPKDYFNSGNLDELGELEDGPRIGDNSGYEDPAEAVEDMNFEDMAKEARKALMKHLFGLMKTGQATPADLNNLRQLLKDNGVVMGDPTEGARSDNPAQAREPRELPSFSTPDYDRR